MGMCSAAGQAALRPATIARRSRGCLQSYPATPEEGQSTASEMGHRDLYDEGESDQEVDLVETEQEWPASDHSGGLWQYRYGATCEGW